MGINGRPLERLVLPPGVRQIAPEEILHRVVTFIEQVPGLAGLVFIGQEGNTSYMRGRPSKGMPDARIRDVLNAALNKFEIGSQTQDVTERIIKIAGMRQLSLSEAMGRINQLVEKCPGLTLVALFVPDMNIERLRRIRSPNLSLEAARAMLRLALLKFDRTGLPPPAA